MSVYERISMVVSLIMLGLLAYLLIELPTRAVELTLFGSPLTLLVSERWLMALLLGGLAGTGTRAIIRSRAGSLPTATTNSLSYWLLPALLVIVTTLVLPWLAVTVLWWTITISVAGLVLWFTMLAEYHVLEANDRWSAASQIWLNLIGYSVAFGFFFTIYQSRSRSLLSATGIMLVTGLLALSQLRTGAKPGRAWLYAGIVALVLGQSTWALNYWRIPSLTASLWLLLLYYLFTGLGQQHLLGRLNRRALIEFLSVTVIGLIVLFQVVP